MSRISDVVNKIMQISDEMDMFYLVSFDKGFKGNKCFIFKCGVLKKKKKGECTHSREHGRDRSVMFTSR